MQKNQISNPYPSHSTKRFQFFHQRYLTNRPKKNSLKTNLDLLLYKIYFWVLIIFSIFTLLTSLHLPFFKIVNRITESLCEVTTLTLFLCVTHYSLHHKFFQISYEHTLWLHKKAGKHTIKLVYINGLFHLLPIMINILPMANLSPDQIPTTRNNVSAISAAVIIYVLRRGLKYRKRCYEFFYYSHIAATLIYVPVFALSHPIKPFLFTAAFGFALWLADLLYRIFRYFFYQKGRIVKVVSQSSTGKPDSNYRPDSKILIIEIKNFTYEPMQWVRLCIPSIAKYQMHALTICSPPRLPDAKTGKVQLKILIKTLGDWSREIVETPDSFFLNKKVILEGPHGTSTLSVLDYRYLILIGGGCGVGPVLSLMLSLIDLNKKQFGDNLIKLKFYWVMKEFQNLELFQKEFDQFSRLIKKYQIEVYVTRQKKLELEKDYTIPNYVKFEKPNISKVIQDSAVEAQKNSLKKMAIFSCGPSSMMKEIQNTSIDLSNDKFSIDISREITRF
ncbi:nadph oxidase 4 [Anaeramoeba flamelloides]|uniref:Nadph oxidase 4 n=1 Tax=Anaeramoeba flamelloides TaxID=1746091 RepID=A0ABQ8XS58_9EUKA|nr:nadph oxidase 4 [Anaeramoeba flamelloides]